LKSVFVREKLICGYPVETHYYSIIFAKLDVCTFFASDGGNIDTELKKRYKTVLPICEACRGSGKVAIVQIPFGKNTTEI